MRNVLSILGEIFAVVLVMAKVKLAHATVKLAEALIKFVRSAAKMWADRDVHRLFRDCAGGVRRVLLNPPSKMLLRLHQPHRRRAIPARPLAARICQWVDAGILCAYVAVLLTIAATVATVATFAVPHMAELNPLAEPTAVLFVLLVCVVADFFYKEALILRSEVTGLPALVT